MELVARTPAEACRLAVDKTLELGAEARPRGLPTLELTDVQIFVKEPWRVPPNLPGRKLSMQIAMLEAAQLVAGVSTPELLPAQFYRYKEPGDNTLHGAYGPRAYGLAARCVELLKKDPESRQAVMTIYDSWRDLGRDTADVPCTIAIQFMQRLGTLYMRVNMRSNDAYLGLPYDLTQFSALHAAVAAALHLRQGVYCHAAASLHLYRENEDQDLHSWKPGEQPGGPVWSFHDMATLQRWCRDLLFGVPTYKPSTPFEHLMAKQIHEARS